MTLHIYCSFESASLCTFVDYWRDTTAMSDAVVLHGPAELAWGLSSALGAAERRAFVLDAPGVVHLFAHAASPIFAATDTRAVPVVALLPDPWGRVEHARFEGIRATVLDMGLALRDAGITEVHDAESDAIAAVPFTDAALAVVATSLVREVYRRSMPAPKVIAVDADGTLWQGLCAEAGPAGVELTDDDLWMQRWLVEQRRRGTLLAMVSKNVIDDVAAVFGERTEMPLAWSDFVVVRAGWESKALVLRDLARDLNLGLDAFAFIDDSSAECAEVRALCPEVAVVQRPQTGVADLIGSTWCFDRRDDGRDALGADGTLGAARTTLYQEDACRRVAARIAPSYAAHIASLEVRTTMRVAGLSDHARVFELAQRTNQFNTCADRPTTDAVRGAIERGGVLVVHVTDRFGDYGVCGAVFAERVDDRLEVSRMLLSCRVLGRGVEADVMDALVARAREDGAVTLRVRIAPTGRNLPARRFFDGLQAPGTAKDVESANEARTLTFTLDALTPCPRYAVTDATAPAMPPSMPPSVPQLRSRDWTAISAMTRSAPALLRAAGFATASLSHDEPLLADDHEVMQIVGQVLGVPVTAESNLYALGADSLRLVRILARLKSRLGLDLPIGDVMHRADMSSLLAMARAARGAIRDEEDDYFGQVQALYAVDDAGR